MPQNRQYKIVFYGLVVFNIAAVIIAGVKANEGQLYKYPRAIQLFK